MQASCSLVTNDVRSICVGCRWVVKGRKTSAYASLYVWYWWLHFKSWEKIKMFNDGTDPTAGIDKDYQNEYTATLNFPKNWGGPESDCCGASVASEQQHKQDLRRIYKRENEFSKSSLFTRMLCGFLPECIAPSTRVHCATNNTRLWHCSNGVFSLRGLQLRQVSGYGSLWFTCKTMWARSCLAFTTLAVVVNAEFESLEIWTINCDVLI